VLETKYQWKGLCIEPNPQYWEKLAYRTNCKTVAAVVGNERMEEVRFRFDAGDHGGIAGQGFDNGMKFKAQSQVRYTVTLEEILTKFHAPSHIDYLSLDVEGAEEFIMKGFPFDKYQISIMTTERPSNPLREVLDKNGFKNVARLTRWGEVMWAHKDVWDSLDMAILDRLDEIKAFYAKKYTE
jgi:FkbM family methyltransferase